MNKRLRKIYENTKLNYQTIYKTYNVLENTYELGIPIHPAGQWILDNMYIIEQQYEDILESKKSIKNNVKLQTIKTGDGAMYTSIYHIADELIEEHNGYTDQNYIINSLKENQKVSHLTTDEINLFPLMIKIAIIKFIARICLNITNSQIQKIRVERILEKSMSVKNTNAVKKIISEELKMFKDDPYISKKLKSTNTAFVEYLAFRLKDYGDGGEEYYNILNNEAEKIGFTVEEAIIKEHMEIAKTADYVGKAITGIKNLDALNFREIFEKVCKIDEILMEDYTGEFKKCDYKTKARYRNRVIKLSKKYKISETYIAKKAVECSVKYRKHVGFFLSGEEKYLLNKALGKPYLEEKLYNNVFKPIKPYIYVLSIQLLAVIFAVVFVSKMFTDASNLIKVFYFIISFIFGVEIFQKIINYLIRKVVPPKILPRFDFAKTIDKESSTYIVMPSVITSLDKIDTMIRKMEVTYLANRSENMYYMLLGDCVASDKKEIEVDEKYVEYLKLKLDELNEKYSSEHNLFNAIYRKRVYSKAEECYMGWERKRGALKQFNELILGISSKDEIEKSMNLIYDDIVRTKYAITIDEDTELSLNTAKDLVAIIAHPLNAPRLSKNGKIVKSGHALIQPAVGLDIVAANKSLFSKIFGGFGGIDIYTNAVSDTYQDVFNEAIFCGKGIYDIEMFERLLGNEIPENLVLSHDLLEGSFMRAGLASDIQVEDGFPNNYIAYMKRNHRWYRGDMQITGWLFSLKSPLNFLSKWKILDNLRRPLNDVFGVLVIIVSLFFSKQMFINTILLTFLAINFGHIISILDMIIFGKKRRNRELQYIPIITGVRATVLNMTFDFLTMPYRAYVCLDAFLRSLYRMYISKKHLLEWTTAETLEKTAKSSMRYYMTNMYPNLLMGIVIMLDLVIEHVNIVNCLLEFCIAISFFLAPLLAYLLGKNYLFEKEEKLNKKEKEEVLEIAKRTWLFFETNITSVNNYLITDNYQENRRFKIVNRTSSTNIGLELIAIMNAYDLKFITVSNMIDKLYKVIKTIDKLEKWNGHLLNWYNIKTLEPLKPRFISTVDSGNFVACMYTIKSFLLEIIKEYDESTEEGYDTFRSKVDIEKVKEMLDITIKIIDETDFTKLYDMSRNLFTIGYAQDEGKLIDSYYDMLMSENRTTSLIAIASRQVTSKHWFALSRKMVKVDGYKGLVSWSGTAFEYYMPYIFIQSYPHTLIDQSLFFVKYSNEKYAKLSGINVWGISESAYALKDNSLNYQYKAFGVPWLGLKRGLRDSLVISPYSSLLMINYAPVEVYKNIQRLKKIGSYGSFGFYESIDYTKKHLDSGKEYEIVKTYMAHHQGMVLSAINNYVNDNIIQKRFKANASIEATDILLKEREKLEVNIIKEKNLKNKIFKQKNIDKYTMFVVNKYLNAQSVIDNSENENAENSILTREGEKIKGPKIAFLRGKDLSSIVTSNGSTYLKYFGKIVNRQKYRDMELSANKLYLTDMITGKIVDTSNTDKIENLTRESEDSYIIKTNFYVTLSYAEYFIQTKDFETTTTCFLSPDYNMEIRKVSIYNTSNVDRTFNLTTFVEPAMTDFMTEIVHPSFNNLQIETYYDKELDTLVASKRLKNENDTEMYVFAKLIGIDKEAKSMETEKQKFDGTYKSSGIPYDNNIAHYPLWPILSYMANIKVGARERRDIYYCLGVADSKYKISSTVINITKENIAKEHALSCELNTVESRYLKLEANEALRYNELLYEVMFEIKRIEDKYFNKNLSQSMLWKYSISGDLPILLIKIDSVDKMNMINKVIDFMEYVKNRSIDLDIIILVNDELYVDKVYDYVKERLDKATFMDYTKGNIYLFNEQSLSKEDIELFEFVSRKIINSERELVPYMKLKEQEESTMDKVKEMLQEKISFRNDTGNNE